MAHKDWVRKAAGTTCPAPMTRAALITLRNSGGLTKDCDYVVTDHVQGRLVAGTTLHLQAVDATTLAMHAQVKTTYDNVAWEGRYDIDTGLVYELRDNRNNVVIGAGAVAAFDWGNTAYTDCRVEHATWNLTIGQALTRQRVRVLDGATLTTTGTTGGSLVDFEVSKLSGVDLSNSNVTIQRSTVTEQGTLNASGYVAGGTGIMRLRLRSSTLTLGAGSGPVTVTSASIDDGSTVTHSGAGSFSLNQSKVLAGSTVTHGSALPLSLSGCVITGGATTVTHQIGTLTMTGTQVGPYGRIVKTNAGAVGALSVSYCVVDTLGYIEQAGAGDMSLTGATIRNQSFVRSLAGSAVPVLTVIYTDLDGSSRIDATATATAGNFTAQYCRLSSNAYIQKSGTGLLVANGVDVSGNGRIDLAGVRSLSIVNSMVTNVGRILGNATAGAGVIDSVNYVTVQDYAVVQFNASGAAANQLNYSSVRGLTANVTFLGTNTGSILTRFDVANGNVTFNNNTAAMPTLLDIGVRDQGILNVTGCTAAQDIRYSTAQSYSRWNITNKTVAGQLFGIDVAANGTLTNQGAAANCYYAVVRQGSINHNGGSLTTATKTMPGTLTTGAFNHTGIQHHVNGSKTLTVSNTSRADYQGLAAQLV